MADMQPAVPDQNDGLPRSPSTLPQYKLTSEWKDKLWIPGVYFCNAFSGSVFDIITPTFYFVVTNYTQVTMIVRINFVFNCRMDFAHYPFDTQRCFLNLSSSEYRSKGTVRSYRLMLSL